MAIIYLRDDNNKTLFEVETYVKTEYNEDGTKHSFVETHGQIHVAEYSLMLISLISEQVGLDDNDIARKKAMEKMELFISSFDELSEIRGWMWETYFANKDNVPEELERVRKAIQVIVKYVAIELKLNIVTD